MDRVFGWRQLVLACLALVAMAPDGETAFAEPAATTTASSSVSRHHTLYIDVLGKNGFWGIGYDARIKSWLGAGVSASFWTGDGEHTYSLSPYLAAYPVAGKHHAWFLHTGPLIVRTDVISPVPEWPGATSTGVGMELSSGYEYRNHVVIRLYAMGAAGRGGATPWLGASLGWSL